MHVRVSAPPHVPLVLAAAKTNDGHLEIAAGSLGFIKCIKLVTEGGLPPNLHLRRCNPHIDQAGFPSIMPTETICHTTTGYAGVSSFGFGGTNAHALICSPRRQRPTPRTPTLHFDRRSFRWRHIIHPHFRDTGPNAPSGLVSECQIGPGSMRLYRGHRV
jgi:acyl transferase domain-containing protein